VEVAAKVQQDRVLHPHFRYYVREVRVVAYSQASDYTAKTLLGSLSAHELQGASSFGQSCWESSAGTQTAAELHCMLCRPPQPRAAGLCTRHPIIGICSTSCRYLTSCKLLRAVPEVVQERAAEGVAGALAATSLCVSWNVNVFKQGMTRNLCARSS